MKQERPKNGRKLLYIIAVLLGLMAGCVAAPALTPEQVTQINVECNDDAVCIIEATDKAMENLLFQIEYDRQEKRDIERDKLCAVMQSCNASNEHVMYTTRRVGHGKGARLDRYGECIIPKRERLRDYQCVNRSDLLDAMRRAGLMQ